jgi:hypothetical protein
MAVQLSVFPQQALNTAPLANSGYDYYVDGINWSSLNGSGNNSLASSATFVQQQVNHYEAAGMYLNTFYRGYDTSPATVYQSSGGVIFETGQTCILQKLNNIFIGVNYLFKYNITSYTSGGGEFRVHEYNSTNFVATHILTPTASVSNTVFVEHNIQFSSPHPTVVIEYDGGTAPFGLNNFKIRKQTSQPTTYNTIFNSGEVLLDLYADETIPLTLSVDDFTKIAEKVQSYSKSFNIPQTKRNQRTFNNIFSITRLYDGVIFNPYMQTKAVLKVDGFLVFEGFLRLIDVSDKNGEVSYNVNLYSEAIALKDYLEKKIIGDIDFTELEHEYQITNIKNSWNTSGTGITYDNAGTSGYRDANDTLKYPFVDWKHQYTYSTDDMPIIARLEDVWRPWIQIKYLINRIFEDTPFSWSSTFFNDAQFERLYMDFNWGEDGVPLAEGATNYNMLCLRVIGSSCVVPSNCAVPTSFTALEIGSTTAIGSTPPQVNTTTGVFTATNDNTTVTAVIDGMAFENTTGSDIDVTIKCVAIIGGITQDINIQTFSVPASITGYVPPTYTVFLEIDNLDSFSLHIESASAGVNIVFTATPTVKYTVSILSVVNSAIMNTLRGEMGQWEFIAAILKMFNLVTLPSDTNPNEIQFETYADTFIKQTSGGAGSGDVTLSARGVVHNWTEKIDVENIKLKPLTDLKAETIFRFEEDDDDYSYGVYKKATRHLYGSKVFDASGATLLTGEDDISAEPFASTVIKRLENYLTEFVTPSIYAFDPDSGSSDFDNAPRILYSVGTVTMSSDTYEYPAQNGVAGSTTQDSFLQFSHTTSVPAVGTNYDFVFGEQFLFTGVGISPLNNLFNLYWLPYYNELYNPDTRTMTLKLNLSAADINTFKFNDQVFIKQRVFRVNKIDYKPNDLSTVEFILIP